MTDKQWIVKITKMDLKELFSEVMERPELLTDGYYRNLGSAITARYYELLKEEHNEQTRQ